MPNLPVEALTCDLCPSTENLFVPSQSSILFSFVHSYKVLCIDCFPEYIDKVTRRPYLFKHCSRN